MAILVYFPLFYRAESADLRNSAHRSNGAVLWTFEEIPAIQCTTMQRFTTLTSDDSQRRFVTSRSEASPDFIQRRHCNISNVAANQNKWSCTMEISDKRGESVTKNRLAAPLSLKDYQRGAVRALTMFAADTRAAPRRPSRNAWGVRWHQPLHLFPARRIDPAASARCSNPCLF